MKLEIGDIHIDTLTFGPVSVVEGHTVSVNRDELTTYLKAFDKRIASLELDIARPGESVRIMPVKDVLEPRVKVSGQGAIFPGIGKNGNDMVGSGRTHVLKGMAIVTTGKIVGFQEGVIDMSGPGADYCPFSDKLNLVITAEVDASCTPHEHEAILRKLGQEAALWAGRLAKDVEPHEVSVFETKSLAQQVIDNPDLPRVGYVDMLQSQGLMHDTYLYGVDAKQILPTLLEPTEAMDGALTSGNCVAASDKVTTYMHQNNPVITELFKHHGTRYNFVGVIVTNENVTLKDKERSSAFTTKLASQLGLDAVIVTEEGYGNPDTDLVMNCRQLENAGIQTVLITDEFAGRMGESQALADSTDCAKAMVTCGNGNPVVHLPAMDKVIGHLDTTDIIVGGYEGSLRADGSMDIEIQGIIGATSAIGFHNLAADAG